MSGDQNVLQCDQVSIELCSINGFTKDVVKARSVYMCLHISCQYDDWLEDMIEQRTLAKDFFYTHSEKGLDCLFSIDMAKEIAISDMSEAAGRLVAFLHQYQEQVKKKTLNNVLLSDSDKNAIVQDFAQSLEWDEKAMVLPADTVIAMVDTIRLCKMQIDQIQKRLDKFDFSGLDFDT